jgi:hypothetical protein
MRLAQALLLGVLNPVRQYKNMFGLAHLAHHATERLPAL